MTVQCSSETGQGKTCHGKIPGELVVDGLTVGNTLQVGTSVDYKWDAKGIQLGNPSNSWSSDGKLTTTGDLVVGSPTNSWSPSGDITTSGDIKTTGQSTISTPRFQVYSPSFARFNPDSTPVPGQVFGIKTGDNATSPLIDIGRGFGVGDTLYINGNIHAQNSVAVGLPPSDATDPKKGYGGSLIVNGDPVADILSRGLIVNGATTSKGGLTVGNAAGASAGNLSVNTIENVDNINNWNNGFYMQGMQNAPDPDSPSFHRLALGSWKNGRTLIEWGADNTYGEDIKSQIICGWSASSSPGCSSSPSCWRPAPSRATPRRASRGRPRAPARRATAAATAPPARRAALG